LNPNLAWALLFSGWVKVLLGEPGAAIDRISRAMRLSPQDAQFFNMQAALACAPLVAGRYSEALTFAWAEVRGHQHYILSNSIVAASAALAGRLADAQKAVARLRQIDSALRISSLKELVPMRRSEDMARWTEGLREAGVPE